MDPGMWLNMVNIKLMSNVSKIFVSGWILVVELIVYPKEILSALSVDSYADTEFNEIKLEVVKSSSISMMLG